MQLTMISVPLISLVKTVMSSTHASFISTFKRARTSTAGSRTPKKPLLHVPRRRQAVSVAQATSMDDNAEFTSWDVQT